MRVNLELDLQADDGKVKISGFIITDPPPLTSTKNGNDDDKTKEETKSASTAPTGHEALELLHQLIIALKSVDIEPVATPCTRRSALPQTPATVKRKSSLGGFISKLT